MPIKEQASLYRRWNPEKLSDICGNAVAKAKCETLISQTPVARRPGFYLITGDTGTGKSTLAHILFKAFGCTGDMDIQVYNSRDAGNVEFVRNFLTEELPSASLLSANRAYIFEEAHNITAAAQEMFMEPLEKGIPANTYVAFVTNSPEKLTGGKGALLSRPCRIDTVGINPKDMIGRLTQINEAEPLGLTAEDVLACAANAGRSMRVAINNMHRLSILPVDLREQELNSIKLMCETTTEEFPPDLRDLAMAVESREWSKVSEVLTRLRAAKEDPEGLRRGLLAWFSGAMISPKPFFANKRVFAQACVDALRDSYYNTGFAGLIGDLSHLATKGL